MEVGVRELRNHLSRYLDRVRDGDELVVTDRGRAIARVVPVGAERVRDPNVVVIAGDGALLEAAAAEGMAVGELP
jgi:prevent-host-death family protein